MQDNMMLSSVTVCVVRWTARIWSVLALGVLLLFAFGEGLNLAHFNARELVLFLFFPLGVFLGMALAWRWEGLGGSLAVASLVAFCLVNRIFSSSFPRGFAFVALAAPGFLFLLCAILARANARKAEAL